MRTTRRIALGWIGALILGVAIGVLNVPLWLSLLVGINYIVWLMWWIDKGGGKPPGRGTETMLALLLAITLAATAEAHTIAGLSPVQHRALERTWLPLPEGVVVVQQPCPPIPNTSCVIPSDRNVYLHPRHSTHPFVLWHELGHHFHLQYMNAVEQREYATMAGLPTWDAEHFADRYAACLINPDVLRRVYRPSRQERLFVSPMLKYHQFCRSLTKWWAW